MNYKEVSRGLPREEAEKYSQGIALMGNLADSLQKQGLLPKRFAQALEISAQPEVVAEAIRFTDEEREALVGDGAVLYLPTGETIQAQRAARRPFWYVADGYKEGGRNRVTEFPSRLIEVAIYPDPERFFVPATASKTTDQQIALVEQDAHALRERLGLPNIGQVLPEASEATEVLFKHFDATGVRILGQDYMRNGYWSYIRTSTPTNKEGSRAARVGDWRAASGLRVDDRHRDDGDVDIHAARWVVPTGSR